MRPFPAIVLAIACLGCGVTEPEPLPLRVDIRVSSAEVSATRPVEIVVRGTNVSDGPLSVTSHGCPQTFDVHRATDGRLVGPRPVACALIVLPPTLLDPGGSLSFRYDWAGSGSEPDGDPLPPGRYWIRGWMSSTNADRAFSDALLIEIRSP